MIGSEYGQEYINGTSRTLEVTASRAHRQVSVEFRYREVWQECLGKRRVIKMSIVFRCNGSIRARNRDDQAPTRCQVSSEALQHHGSVHGVHVFEHFDQRDRIERSAEVKLCDVPHVKLSQRVEGPSKPNGLRRVVHANDPGAVVRQLVTDTSVAATCIKHVLARTYSLSHELEEAPVFRQTKAILRHLKVEVVVWEAILGLLVRLLLAQRVHSETLPTMSRPLMSVSRLPTR